MYVQFAVCLFGSRTKQAVVLSCLKKLFKNYSFSLLVAQFFSFDDAPGLDNFFGGQPLF
jgi:hypothetical protein